MVPSCVSQAILTGFYGLYTGGMSYILQASALDQKIFNFSAPKFRDAVAFGCAWSLARLALEVVIRKLTDTSFDGMCDLEHRHQIHSNYLTIYKICNFIAPIIATLSSVYLLKQMNYSASYRFAAVCVFPFVLKSIVTSNDSPYYG